MFPRATFLDWGNKVAADLIGESPMIGNTFGSLTIPSGDLVLAQIAGVVSITDPVCERGAALNGVRLVAAWRH